MNNSMKFLAIDEINMKVSHTEKSMEHSIFIER